MNETEQRAQHEQNGLFVETAFSSAQVDEARLAEVEKGVTDEPCAFVGRLGNVDPGQQ